MIVQLSQCYQVPDMLTLWSTAGQFSQRAGKKKRQRSFLRYRMLEEMQQDCGVAKLVWPGAESEEAAQTGAGFSSPTLTAPQTVWVKVRGHCHCVPSSANSSLVSRQSHNRQHSWERGRVGTCSTPRLFRGLFRDSFMLFSLLLHV